MHHNNVVIINREYDLVYVQKSVLMNSIFVFLVIDFYIKRTKQYKYILYYYLLWLITFHFFQIIIQVNRSKPARSMNFMSVLEIWAGR